VEKFPLFVISRQFYIRSYPSDCAWYQSDASKICIGGAVGHDKVLLLVPVDRWQVQSSKQYTR
jgi:hypothetical protein